MQNQKPELNDDEEYVLDAVKGMSGAKKRMALLNKSRIAKHELDELFLGDDDERY